MQTIDDLRKLSKPDLLELWEKLPGKKPPPPARIDRLLRELAYRKQEKCYGSLDKNTKVSLHRHMMAFEASLTAGKDPTPIQLPRRIKLEAGTVLFREWNGRKITVQVIGPKEFQFEDKRYKSLTPIAKIVTGQHMSGPRFFRLEVPRA